MLGREARGQRLGVTRGNVKGPQQLCAMQIMRLFDMDGIVSDFPDRL
jgi:hypothetical protein